MKAWEWVWFQKLIAWLRKWPWFEKYIYGQSLNMEDFTRNPADVLFRAISIRNVAPFSLFNLRIYFISPNNSRDVNIPTPTGLDIKMFSPWVTKFSNAWLWIQITICMKWWIPIPCIMVHFRPIEYWYFQGAIGISPEMVPDGTYNDRHNDNFDAMPYAKFRFVNDKTSNERIWNPTDQRGWNEGGI